jgi:ABC-2 type transport system ATP-binding protein
MLIGLLTPTDGQIRVDGIDVLREPRRVRDHVGYMGQKVSLYTGLSVRENVEFYGGLYGLSNGDLERRWGELRSRFELQAAERERTEDLPAGIRQRAGLALAILHRPRVLFLDEPTAGVDLENRERFWDAIREERDAGVTVFVTTHFLEEAEHCDHVSFIAAGRLIADAPPQVLRARHSGGYRVEIALPPGDRERAAARLGLLEPARVAATAEGFELRAPDLGPDLLAALGRVVREAPGARVRIEEPPMDEVFRNVIADAEAAARDAA